MITGTKGNYGVVAVHHSTAVSLIPTSMVDGAPLLAKLTLHSSEEDPHTPQPEEPQDTADGTSKEPDGQDDNNGDEEEEIDLQDAENEDEETDGDGDDEKDGEEFQREDSYVNWSDEEGGELDPHYDDYDG